MLQVCLRQQEIVIIVQLEICTIFSDIVSAVSPNSPVLSQKYINNYRIYLLHLAFVLAPSNEEVKSCEQTYVLN